MEHKSLLKSFIKMYYQLYWLGIGGYSQKAQTVQGVYP